MDSSGGGSYKSIEKKKSAFDVLLSSAKKATSGCLPNKLYRAAGSPDNNDATQTTCSLLQLPQWIYNQLVLSYIEANVSVSSDNLNNLRHLTRTISRILICFHARVPQRSFPKRFQLDVQRRNHSDRNRSYWIQEKLKGHRDILIQSVSPCPFLHTQRWTGIYNDILKLEDLLTKVIGDMAMHAEKQHLLRLKESDNIETRLVDKRWIQPCHKLLPRYH